MAKLIENSRVSSGEHLLYAFTKPNSLPPLHLCTPDTLRRLSNSFSVSHSIDWHREFPKISKRQRELKQS